MAAAIFVQLLFAAVLGFAFALQALDPDRFHRLAQEDQALEWATFWAFVAAGVTQVRVAVAERRQGRRWPWFAVGVALFCGFVAMEEISWGQRLWGWQSPELFLAHNFQQETNLHNVADGDLRQLAFLLVTLGYGVGLAGLARVPRLAGLAERLGVAAPPLWLAPPFVAIAVVYEVYPWDYAGEWSEALLGLGMLVAAVAVLGRATAATSGSAPRLTGAIAIHAAVALLLGVGTAAAWNALAVGSPEELAAAKRELAALRDDYAQARSRTRCGLHKRVYTHVVQDGLRHLESGAFAGLGAAGLPEARARYFVDPWGSPYWIRHACAEDGSRRAILVYSFGPNRHRDSGEWTVAPDDMAAWIIRPDPEAPR